MRKMIPLFLISLVVLTGCWDRIELNDISIVSGIAIDPGEKQKFRMTVEIINSAEFAKQGGQGNAPVISFSLEGDSIPELANKMNVGLSKRLVYSHTRVLFIHEKVAKAGFLGFLDYLERSGDFRNDFNIIVAKGRPAAEFVKMTYPTQRIPSQKIHDQAQSLLDVWGGDPGIRINDFIEQIVSKGVSPVTNSVIIQGDPEKGKKVDNMKSVEPEALTVFDGMAIFDNDGLKGYLSLEDTRNYTWTKKLKSTNLSIPCNQKAKVQEEQNTSFNLRIIHNSSSVQVDYKNDVPVLKVTASGEAMLEGTQCTNDLTKIETYKEFEKRAEDEIAKNIKTTVEKVQDDFGIDIFGFGEAYNRKHHKQFKKVEDKWNEEFARGKVEVDIDIHLRRSGIRNKSFLTDLK